MTLDRADLTALVHIHPDELDLDLDRASDARFGGLRALYHRWERQSWSTEALDFSQDRRDWAAFSDGERQRLLWFMSMLFHGEQRVGADLSPWIGSAPADEIQLFVSTQIADEARHTIFFDRFYDEVVAAGPTMGARLDASRPQLSPAFQRFFYEMLPAVAAEVRDNPGDPVVYARGVAFYHLIIEGTMAVPIEKYLIGFCRDRDVLPGFRAGFTAVARDESRHVGAGAQILRELGASHPETVPAVQDMIRSVMPTASEAFIPPGGDFTYATDLGFSMSELYRFALRSLAKRLRAAGQQLPAVPEMCMPAPSGEPVLTLGEPTATQLALRSAKDTLTPGMIFQALPMVFDPETARGVSTAFRFEVTGEDGGTWTIAIRDGSCELTEGDNGAPWDWRVELSRDTWLSIATGELREVEAFLLGRTVVEGDIAAGLEFDRYFVS
jgi:ribonucleoside-diphosphate reductase beta chain